MASNNILGRRGEDLAAAHLRSSGHVILDRNWRSRRGELDIVSLADGWVVVTEVKTRSGLGYGHPFAAIDPTKLGRLYRLGLDWCREHRRPTSRLRIDAIAVIAAAGAKPTVEHLVGIH